jgi:ubiquinone/menaquinone biosynthesis C-methylase UbiE
MSPEACAAVMQSLTSTFSDLQHNLWLLTLRGALCLSPKEASAKRVLDAGTGTGIWATEYGTPHAICETLPGTSFQTR